MQLIVEKTRQVKRYYTAGDRLLHKRPVLPQGYDGSTEVSVAGYTALTPMISEEMKEKRVTRRSMQPLDLTNVFWCR